MNTAPKSIAAGSLTGQPADATGWRISDRPDDSILSVILLELLAQKSGAVYLTNAGDR